LKGALILFAVLLATAGRKGAPQAH